MSPGKKSVIEPFLQDTIEFLSVTENEIILKKMVHLRGKRKVFLAKIHKIKKRLKKKFLLAKKQHLFGATKVERFQKEQRGAGKYTRKFNGITTY